MATKQKMSWVAFKHATPVPASVLGEAQDRRMIVGQPIQLPAAYAAQMVEGGFATEAEAPKAAMTKAMKAAAKKGAETNAANEQANGGAAQASFAGVVPPQQPDAPQTEGAGAAEGAS